MAAIPAYRSATVLSPTLRVAQRERTAPRVNVAAALFAFVGLTYVFYSAASLTGSVLAEQARRDGIAAMAHAKAARAEAGLLERRLDALKSLGAVDRWAAQNGFIAPDRVLQTSLVASREQ